MLGQVPLTTELSQFPGSLAVGQGTRYRCWYGGRRGRDKGVLRLLSLH